MASEGHDIAIVLFIQLIQMFLRIGVGSIEIGSYLLESVKMTLLRAQQCWF